MTCVLGSPWHPFSASFAWSPMNLEDTPAPSSLERAPSQGYVSSGSESRNRGSGSGKKRASRAGTRSVSTLSAAQLERKRANDREAQRAIRQRTKDHIDSLERNISELRSSQDASEKLVSVTQQKNRELEEEVMFLRTRLSEAGLAISLPAIENPCPPESSLLSVQAQSPATQTVGPSIQRPSSTSTPRNLCVTATHSSSSRHGSWQQSGFGASTPNTTMGVPGGSSVAAATKSLTAWRSHEGIHSQQTGGQDVQDPAGPHAGSPYGVGNPVDRSHWPNNAAPYPYGVQEPQSSQHYQASQPQQQPYQRSPQQQNPQQYAQAPLQSYPTAPASATAQHQQPYHAAQMPPLTEFQSMSVSSPGTYQIPQAQGYAQPTQYMPHVHIPTPGGDYSSPHGQVPQITSQTTYQATTPGQRYAQQPHPSVRYQDESGNQPCPLPHYPSG